MWIIVLRTGVRKERKKWNECEELEVESETEIVGDSKGSKADLIKDRKDRKNRENNVVYRQRYGKRLCNQGESCR